MKVELLEIKTSVANYFDVFRCFISLLNGNNHIYFGQVHFSCSRACTDHSTIVVEVYVFEMNVLGLKYISGQRT